MQPVVRFAFTSYNRAICPANLFKHRNSQRLPEKLAVAVREGLAIEIRQHDDNPQIGQIGQPA